MRRTFLKRTAAIAAAAAARAAFANDWPQRSVRIIIPSAAGSPWDPLARLLAAELTTRLGQTFYVENKPGGTGLLGMNQVVSANDGHTLGFMFMPHVVIPSLFKNMPYDTERDIVPVTMTNVLYNVLVVHPSVQARTIKDLVALAKDKPGTMTVASGGNGSPAHILAEYFQQVTGTSLIHVPYRGPVGALQDLAAGQVQSMFAVSTTALPHIRAGRVRAVAVAAEQRLDVLPDVPTIAEEGYPQLEFRQWAGLVAGRSVPAAAIARLNAHIRQILADPAIVGQFRETGLYIETGSAEDFGRTIREDLRKWAQVLRKVNIKMG